jgi:hypothetical protein
MRPCDAHWKEVTDRLKEAGLEHLFKDKDAMDADPMAFEPRIFVTVCLTNNAVRAIGPHEVSRIGEEECMMCNLINGCSCERGPACRFLAWTKEAVLEAKDMAAEMGLLAVAPAPTVVH